MDQGIYIYIHVYTYIYIHTPIIYIYITHTHIYIEFPGHFVTLIALVQCTYLINDCQRHKRERFMQPISGKSFVMFLGQSESSCPESWYTHSQGSCKLNTGNLEEIFSDLLVYPLVHMRCFIWFMMTYHDFMISLALFTIYHDLPWFTSSPPVQLKVPLVRPETLRCGVTSEADAADARAWVPSRRSICCLAKRTLETTWDPNTTWRCSWGYSSVWL